MKNRILNVLVVLSVVFGLSTVQLLAVSAASRNLPVGCSDLHDFSDGESLYLCPPQAATGTPTVAPSATPSETVTPSDTPAPSNTPAPTIAPSATISPTSLGCAWAAPNGAEEHGDAFPAWVQASAYPACFDFPGNTPNENLISYKHSGFKGYSGTINNILVYAIIHDDVTPAGQSSRFHSFQYWMKDTSGGVSYLNGWMDFGPNNATQTGPNLFHFGCGEDSNLRPVLQVNVQACPNGAVPTGGLKFETWYSAPCGHLGQGCWMPDFGLSTSATYFNSPASSPTDPSTWLPTGGLNLTRRIEIAWYAFRDSHRGLFYATQFGRVVSGPNDPVCGTPYGVGTRSYTVVCLKEYLAPSAVSVQFPNNNFQKDYPGPVHLPN